MGKSTINGVSYVKLPESKSWFMTSMIGPLRSNHCSLMNRLMATLGAAGIFDRGNDMGGSKAPTIGYKWGYYCRCSGDYMGLLGLLGLIGVLDTSSIRINIDINKASLAICHCRWGKNSFLAAKNTFLPLRMCLHMRLELKICFATSCESCCLHGLQYVYITTWQTSTNLCIIRLVY